jgi:hypothetical protein
MVEFAVPARHPPCHKAEQGTGAQFVRQRQETRWWWDKPRRMGGLVPLTEPNILDVRVVCLRVPRDMGALKYLYRYG